DKELDRAVPESEKLNQRISSLIPVAKRGESVDRGASLTQRMADRLKAHTGALTSSVAGGLAFGPLGAVGGLAVPELLASPTAQMAGAKALRSPVPKLLGRAAASQLLGRGRKDEE